MRAALQRESGDLAMFDLGWINLTSVTLPDAPSDWASHAVGDPTQISVRVPDGIEVVEIEGHIYAAYTQLTGQRYFLWFSAAREDDPTEPTDWAHAKVNNTIPPEHTPLITEWAGLPLIAAFQRTSPTSSLSINRSDTLEPEDASDWSGHLVFDSGYTVSGGSGAKVAGRLLMVYKDTANGAVRMIRQVRVDPSDAASWVQIAIDTADAPGLWVTALEYQNRIVVASITQETLQLRISISDEPF